MFRQCQTVRTGVLNAALPHVPRGYSQLNLAHLSEENGTVFF